MTTESQLLDTFVAPIRVCANYKPKLGSGERDEEVDLASFTRIYGSDPLYHWIGIDSGKMFAAHKAAGGLTSLYRQIGTGCERLSRQVIRDALGLTESQISWSYEATKEDGTKQLVTLDARISLDDVTDLASRSRVNSWIQQTSKAVGASTSQVLTGAVFEIRQGYKSADAKRQNADLRSALRAYNSGLMPVMLVLSQQVNRTVLRRYRDASYPVLLGATSGPPTETTYSFLRDVVGYDLAAFFERNKAAIRGEVDLILEKLLSP